MVEVTEKAINKEESAEGIQITELEREPAGAVAAPKEPSLIKATPKAAEVDHTKAPSPKDVQTFLNSSPEAPKADELEALWPGVHHDLSHAIAAKRTPSFYIMMGFIGGAVASLVFVWMFSFTSQQIANNESAADKPILMAKSDVVGDDQATPITAKNADPNAELVPISRSYEVKSGDTLVSIALKNYRKVTPRLIDAIVEKNNLKNANVLNLGQKLDLPVYQQAKQLAEQSSGQVH